MVLGSVNMDLVVALPHLPRPGETVAGERLQTFPGGKGANQAVAAARLGGEVKMVGRVGFDAFGDTLIHALGSDGVETSRIQRDADEPTGAALILVERGGQNMIALAPGPMPGSALQRSSASRSVSTPIACWFSNSKSLCRPLKPRHRLLAESGLG